MIAISNMSMPKSCEDCRCTFNGFGGSTECILGAKRIDWSKRPKDCPLVEPERPQGEWGKHGECPFCSYIRQWEDDKFCANCGADMRKPNCVTCDHFGKCEGCEKGEEE